MLRKVTICVEISVLVMVGDSENCSGTRPQQRWPWNYVDNEQTCKNVADQWTCDYV